MGTPYSILQRSLHTNTTLSDKHFVGWGPTFPMGPLGPGHWGPINGRPGHNQHVSALWRPGVLHTVKAVKQEAKTKVEATERVMCHVQGDSKALLQKARKATKRFRAHDPGGGVCSSQWRTAVYNTDTCQQIQLFGL